MERVRKYPSEEGAARAFAYEAFARNWRCPCCGGRAQVFSLCYECWQPAWGLFARENLSGAAWAALEA